MLDYYDPEPPLRCPVRDLALSGWQANVAQTLSFFWRQGTRFPVTQAIDDDDVRLDPEDLRRFHLPPEFDIYVPCCGANSW